MDEPWRTVLTLVLGLGTGLLSGLFGIGGAVLSTPAIRALGATPLESVGTTLPAIVPSALSGTLHYRRLGLVHNRTVVWTAATGAIAAVAGSLLSREVPGDGHALMLVTAALVGVTGIRMGRSTEPEPIEPPAGAPVTAAPWPGARAWQLVVVGAGAGGLSGLLGVGGGIVMVPAFTQWLRMPIKLAIGTSLAVVAILAIPGTIAHAAVGNVHWGFAIPLSITVVPGARLGAHLTTRTSEQRTRVAVAVALVVVALLFAGGELASL